MKRFLAIFNIMVVSLLLIVMGSGITLVHCNHTGNLSIAQLTVVDDVVQETDMDEACIDDACCGKESEKSCHLAKMSVSKQSCMDYTFVCGQPSNVSVGINWDFSPQYSLVQSSVFAIVCAPFTVCKHFFISSCGRHGPPRSYLRLISVLQI